MKKTNITHSEKTYRGVKSVASSIAQTPAKLHGRGTAVPQKDVFDYYLDLNKESLHYVESITCLMIDSGLRISEALQIGPGSISSDLKVFINSNKGSNNRVISLRYNLEFWRKFRLMNVNSFDHFSRFYFYRYFKRKGLYFKVKGHKHLSVTHSARHRQIKQLQSDGFNRVSRGNYIGHKNVNSQEYYERKIEK